MNPNTGRTGLAVVLWATLPAFAGTAHADEIDAKAAEILRGMSDYVGGLKAFTIKVENSLEVVLRTGQKIQYDNPSTVTIRRPDRLHAVREGDLVNQEFFYDGKSLTLFNPDQKVYATIDAPPNVEAMLDFARDHLNIVAPAGDLVYSDSYAQVTDDLMSSSYVGLGVVAGVRCHHLAFRDPDTDFQIWVEDGARPVPRKLVITSKWIASAPQFTVLVREWNVDPRVSDSTFEFKPPKDMTKVEFLPMGESAE